MAGVEPLDLDLALTRQLSVEVGRERGGIEKLLSDRDGALTHNDFEPI
jgi:hypothetical protein